MRCRIFGCAQHNGPAGRTGCAAGGKLLQVVLLACAMLGCAALSGLYVDNGVDQTLLERALSRRERREVEHEFLSLLGLPERPAAASRLSVRSHLRRARMRHHPHLAASAPQFLLDVYQSLEDHPSAASRGDFNLTGSDHDAIDESDVIMTFTSHNKHVSGLRHERGKRLWFDVSEVPAGEEIVGAELRLYQRPHTTWPEHRDSSGIYTIGAYMVTNLEHGEKELDLVEAVNTTLSNQGWHVFNMTSAFTNWVAFPNSNMGLYLSVRPAEKPGHELKPEDLGLVSAGGDEEKQPFMVAFLKANTVNAKVRTTRSSPYRTKPRRLKKAHQDDGDPLPRNPFADYSTYSDRICKIHNLYVSFKDLEWQDWIIAPEGYSAFYCSGECNFPMNAHMNATNHAIVQTLVHLLYPTTVPKPCCAPTKLTPISVLYFLDDLNVVLKKYKNMVVKSCGCH